MLIYVCSSSHGFGHAARDAAVLQQLRRLRPDWQLVMSSQISSGFLNLLLGDSAIEQRPCRWDVGMIQADALGSDPEATLMALTDLEVTLPDQIRTEVNWIRAQGRPVLVLGDIPPAAADLADALVAPLVWLSNFGWDEIYRPFGGRFISHADRALASYRRGQLLLRCPFDLTMGWDLPEESLELVCSEPRGLPLELGTHLEAIERPIVQVGFGGLGLTLDPALFAQWPENWFVMATPADPSVERGLRLVPNLTLLPSGVRPIDAFPHCERHLGKPGFSTFCEALSLGVGLHVVQRSDFAEVAALMDGLLMHGHHRLLSRHQLNCGDWQLDQPLSAPQGSTLSARGARQAADHLIAVAERYV